MAYKKIDKEFCLTDDSVNVYGYRLLTSGLLLDRYNPPIGFLMHDRDKGVAVRWEDFRTETDKLFAKPVVNEGLFPGLAQQIEDGFYGAASVGHIVALESSDDETSRMDGQTGPTVTKWFPRECSIVDIPGNYNALAMLYDEKGGILHDLSEKPNKIANKQKMEETIKIAELHLPNLADTATREEAENALKDLIDKAERAEKAEKELNELKDAVTREKVINIVDNGMKIHKLTKEMAEKLKKDYSGNPSGLKELVDAMPSQHMVSDTIEQMPEKYAGKNWHDLYLSGELEDVQKNYPALYDKLKNEK